MKLGAGEAFVAFSIAAEIERGIADEVIK